MTNKIPQERLNRIKKSTTADARRRAHRQAQNDITAAEEWGLLLAGAGFLIIVLIVVWLVT